MGNNFLKGRSEDEYNQSNNGGEGLRLRQHIKNSAIKQGQKCYIL